MLSVRWLRIPPERTEINGTSVAASDVLTKNRRKTRDCSPGRKKLTPNSRLFLIKVVRIGFSVWVILNHRVDKFSCWRNVYSALVGAKNLCGPLRPLRLCVNSEGIEQKSRQSLHPRERVCHCLPSRLADRNLNPPKGAHTPMHVTILSLMLSMVWSEGKNCIKFLRNVRGSLSFGSNVSGFPTSSSPVIRTERTNGNWLTALCDTPHGCR